MENLVQSFIDVKTRISGNREKRAYEYTFGTPIETQHDITLPPAHVRRILSQTDFAIKLSRERGGEFDAQVKSALDIMKAALDQDGALTRAAAAEAERELMPLAEAAQEYEVLCAAHAHIDMNWMWSWQETVAATLATFRTMLNLMREYPDFKFSQSQASVYHIVEEYDPDMMREIQERIREGRWEVTASAWVETDKNMPDTESLLRHIRQTRKYLNEVWGVPADSLNIDFSPDTFGHSAFIPEIDTFGGVKYMYHCRGLTTKDVLYRWRAPSGAELLVHREPYWYNSGITPDVGTGAIELMHHSGGLKTSLIVYGVGDHGGGATRRDVERIIEMGEWPVFPRIRFGTFGEYFRRAESVREQLTLRTGELNAIFTGCYTTQSRIKRANRRCEAALLDAETLAAMSGVELPAARSDKAWRDVLFTHFHDILTGSCVQESREHAMGLYSEAMAIANTAASGAMTRISSRIDTSAFPQPDRGDELTVCSQSEGAGAGYGIEAYAGVPNPERGRGRTRAYTVFNPCTVERDEVVELTVWDWPFDMSRLTVLVSDGAPVPFALLTPKREKYWDHLKLRLLARVKVPALGYATLAVTEREADDYPTYRLDDVRTETIFNDIVLENEFLRAVLRRTDGALISLVDKCSGQELIPEGRAGELKLIETEAATSNAWNIGRWTRVLPMEHTIRLAPSSNPLRQQLELEQRVLSSSIKTRISLDAGARALKFEIEADWNEAGRGDGPIPVLVYSAPVAGNAKTYMDVPAGVLNRMPRPEDLPALSFAAAAHGARAAFLASDCKYGYRNWDGELSVTLINSANEPDPYPERGIHHITLWLGIDDAATKPLKDAARALTHPLAICSTGIHKGDLPTCGTLFDFEAHNSVLSSICHEGDSVVAITNELDGAPDEVQLRVPGARSATLTDLNGRELDKAHVEGDVITFNAREHGLTRVAVKLG